MKPTLRERWILLSYRFERWGWFTRWLVQCGRSFQSYRRYSRKPVVVKTTVEVEKPSPPPDLTKGWDGRTPTIRPKLVQQNTELTKSVATALYGVRDPSKKVKEVRLSIAYEDGTSDAWATDKNAGVHIEDCQHTVVITLTSLED